ncbi:Abi family protein [Lacrimispora defluvii]|uniref:Abi family protein n=1 Tax=Lacrimispora defluvii TaxID=2719233 RepID=A0ABX1VYD1_9FIRM|nr:Abi family protein [Lacrimispora defluvii]NNJ33341.1 Abi family protein [Lacrimispora defluvii]
MAKSQDFTSLNEQIELLKKRGLLFESIETAKNLLDNYGYYNIINGYKDPYVITVNEEELYKENITFERIYSLFCLDHAIRNHIMITMLDLEEHLRAVTSYVIGEAFGSNQKDYLNFKNYQNRKTSAKQFSLSGILETLDKTSMSDKNPIQHHRIKYGNVPPWVLFKGVYLSTLINFIKLQKPEQKSAIICRFYPITQATVNKFVKDLFTDTLFICLEYRNLAAHGGRMYNYQPFSKIRITEESEAALNSLIPQFSIIHKTHSLGTLICIFDLFEKKIYRDNVRYIIAKEISRHCEKYPDDLEFLMKSVGINNIAHPKE